MPIHLSFLYLSSATWIATSSALRMVCVSSCPEASIYVVMEVGERITAAPIIDLPFCRDPFVYIQASGVCSWCNIVGCVGEAFESRVWLRVGGRGIKRVFAMVECWCLGGSH